MTDDRPGGSVSAESPDGVVSLGDIPLHSTNLLSLLDADGIIRYQSPSIERLLGFDQTDLVGVSCRDCFHPDDRERVFDAFERIVSADEYATEAVEYRHLTADETYVWVESVTSSSPTSEGYYVINTRDITVRKRQRDELEDANERLTQFASIISHDLRNPLNVASARLELARRERDSEHLRAMDTSIDRMAKMLDELQTLAVGQRRTADPHPVQFASHAERAWATTATGESDLRVLADPATEYEADPGMLDHILENLFRNSVEHGSTGSRPEADDAVVHNQRPVTVTVGSLPEQAGFYVADDGVGIPSDHIDDVLGDGYTTGENGTGFGLTIVSEFVRAHGWTIEVTESDAGGARFEIRVDPVDG